MNFLAKIVTRRRLNTKCVTDMMWALLVLMVLSQTVRGVLTRHNITFSDETTRERHTYGLPYYDYYESQDSGVDSGSNFYASMMQVPTTHYRPVQFQHQPPEGMRLNTT